MPQESEYSNLIPAEERARVEALPYRLPSKLRDLLDAYKWAVAKKNTSAVFIIDGRSGMGKTTLSCLIGKYCYEGFNLEHVCFTPEQFLETLSKAVPGSVVIFDEALLISNRSAMSQINRMIVMAMSMIRSKRIIVIFIVNSIFDLDRNLALSRADLLLNVYGDSLTDRGKFMAFFKGMDGIDRIKLLYLYGKKYYDYGRPKSNFNTTFPNHFALDEAEYERKKQDGVNKFLNSGTAGKIGRAESKARASRDSLILWIRKNTELTIEQIAEIALSSMTQIKDLIAKDKYGEEA